MNEGLNETEYQTFLTEKERIYGTEIFQLGNQMENYIDAIKNNGGVLFKLYNKHISELNLS